MPAHSRRAAGSISLVLSHARMPTLAKSHPGAEAVAIGGPRILAVGRSAEMRSLADGKGQQIDCGGRTLLPGFIDAHIHLLGTAARLRFVDCTAAPSIADIAARIRARAAAMPGEGWIRAFGYHELTLKERRHPHRRDLDRATADRPVRLTHLSGHASVLNSAALARLSITAGTEEPVGGTIDRDPETGEPSGLVLEMEDWLDLRMPRSGEGQMDELLGLLSERLLAAGVTSVQDLGHRNDRRRAEYLAQMVASRAFRPRVAMATGYEAFEAGEDAVAGGLGIGPVKIVLNETGETSLPAADDFRRQVAAVHRRGRQVAIHAIGPEAVAVAVEAIERAQAIDGRRGRHRIEHASITAPPVVARMAAAGAVAVSNPGFIWQNGDRYLSAVASEQLPFLYAVAGLRRGGVLVAAGSDSPAGPIEPATGIAAACSRRSAGGRTVPGDTLRQDEAIQLFTNAAAAAVFEESVKGAIAPGLLADLVLLEESAEGLRPCLTIVGGEIVWSAEGRGPAPIEAEIGPACAR